MVVMNALQIRLVKTYQDHTNVPAQLQLEEEKLVKVYSCLCDF